MPAKLKIPARNPSEVGAWARLHTKGVINVFSHQFGISGLPEIWIMTKDLYGAPSSTSVVEAECLRCCEAPEMIVKKKNPTVTCRFSLFTFPLVFPTGCPSSCHAADLKVWLESLNCSHSWMWLIICLSPSHCALNGGERKRKRERERKMGAKKMNSCLWNLDSIQHSDYPPEKHLSVRMGRQWERHAAYSWKADFSFFLWTEESPFLTSAFFSACRSLYLPPLYSPLPPRFLLLFLFSFSPPPPSWSPITVKLQGDSLGTFFLTEKIWLRSESPASIPAFLSRFKCFFFYLQLHRQHPPRQPDLLTLQVSPTLAPCLSLSLSLSLSLALVHTTHFFHFALLSPLSRTYKHAHTKKTKKNNTIQTL